MSDEENADFCVVRIEVGRFKGRIVVLPLKRRNRFRTRFLNLRGAFCLLSGVTYAAAYWYASGVLRGENGITMSPYLFPGNAEVWKRAGFPVSKTYSRLRAA